MPGNMTEGQWADHHAEHMVNPSHLTELQDMSKTGVLGVCEICDDEKHRVKHHVCYEPEETILICRSCHTKIHRNEDFHPELTPDHVPKESRWEPDMG